MTNATSTAPKKRTGIGDILMRLGPLMVLAILFIVFSIALPDKFLTMANQMNIPASRPPSTA